MLIFACARMDEVKRRALAGDTAAIAILVKLAPHDLPQSARHELWTEAISGVAEQIRAVLPNIRPRPLAELIAAAGAQLATGQQHVSHRTFDAFATSQREAIEAATRRALELAPQRQSSKHWVTWRTIWNILR